jgi:hypothetical protein
MTDDVTKGLHLTRDFTFLSLFWLPAPPVPSNTVPSNTVPSNTLVVVW